MATLRVYSVTVGDYVHGRLVVARDRDSGRQIVGRTDWSGCVELGAANPVAVTVDGRTGRIAARAHGGDDQIIIVYVE
jgi:hypothetical protein